MSIGHSSRVRTTALQQDDGSLLKDQQKWHENHGRYPPIKLTWQWNQTFFNTQYIYSWWLFMDFSFLNMLLYWRVYKVTIVNDSYVILLYLGVLVAPLNPRFPLTTRRTQRCCTATKIPTRKLLINRRKLATRILGEATSIRNEKHWKLIDLTCDFILRTMWVKLLTQSYDETNESVKFLAELLFQQQSTYQTLDNLFHVAMVGPHQFQVQYTVVPNEWLWLVPINDIHADPSISFDTTHIQVVWMPLGWYHSCSYGMTLHSAGKRLPQIGWLLWSLQFTPKPIPKHKVIYPSEIDMSSWGYERTI